jgi:hypothetical protein
VLIRKLFVIEIVDEANDSPFLLILAALSGNVAHHPFDGVGMLAQGFRLVILMQKLQGFLPRRYSLSHR